MQAPKNPHVRGAVGWGGSFVFGRARLAWSRLLPRGPGGAATLIHPIHPSDRLAGQPCTWLPAGWLVGWLASTPARGWRGMGCGWVAWRGGMRGKVMRPPTTGGRGEGMLPCEPDNSGIDRTRQVCQSPPPPVLIPGVEEGREDGWAGRGRVGRDVPKLAICASEPRAKHVNLKFRQPRAGPPRACSPYAHGSADMVWNDTLWPLLGAYMEHSRARST
jgi:hypothetical protein